MIELTRLEDVPMKCSVCGCTCKYEECSLNAEGWPVCPIDCGVVMVTAKAVRLTEGGDSEQLGRGIEIARVSS